MEAPIPYVNGIFKRAYSWVADAAAGLKMDPARMDADANDIALGLSNALLRDGTGLPTADISFAGHAATNLKAPANAGDALSLGTTPSSEISRALGFQPASSLGGHQIAFTYDGAGLVTSVDGNGVFGRVWTANTLGAAQVEGILGFVPCTNYSGTAHAVGLAYDGHGIIGVVDGNSNFGYLYGTYNFNAGTISSVLGYTPAMPTTVIETSAGGVGDIAPNQRQYVVGVNFTAQAPNFLGFARTSFLNNSAGGSQDVFLNAQLIDVTAGGGQANIGVETNTTAVYGHGWHQASAMTACSGLTIGHIYQLRCYVYKTSTGSVVACSNFQLDGMNF